MAKFVLVPNNQTWKQEQKGDFLGGIEGKNQPANAEDIGSIPGLGRFHMPQSN